MRRKKTKEVRTTPQALPAVVVSLVIVLTILGLIHKLTAQTRLEKPLTKLALPPIPKTYLPEPLTITPFSSSVLGAQVFNPVDVITEINKEREKVSAKPLRIHASLMKAAQMRADVIMKYQNFSHYDPIEHLQLDTVFPKVGYNYIYASENIGMGGNSGADFVNGFMHSTLHRINLQNPDLMDTGVGLATGPYQQWYVNVVVQLFAIPAGRNEYLGYTDKEKEQYRLLLADVSARLDPIDWLIGQAFKNTLYTEEKKLALEKQRTILQKIYSRMREEQPLSSADVALILEYNALIENQG